MVQKRCYDCRELKEFNNPDNYLCDDCLSAGVRMTPTVCHGLSDGPGNSYICFDRPNPAKEMEQTFKVMEENGKFNDPVKKQKAMKLLQEVKSANYKKVDYGKGDSLND